MDSPLSSNARYVFTTQTWTYLPSLLPFNTEIINKSVMVTRRLSRML
jgi:hypothetical protein